MPFITHLGVLRISLVPRSVFKSCLSLVWLYVGHCHILIAVNRLCPCPICPNKLQPKHVFIKV
jgi:hypothetical protein